MGQMMDRMPAGAEAGAGMRPTGAEAGAGMMPTGTAAGAGAMPALTVDLGKLRDNVHRVKALCAAQGIRLTAVMKGCSGLPACAQVFREAGVEWIGTSRLDQVRRVTDAGVAGPFMLVRVPMPSEAEAVVRLTDISLNSEPVTLRALDRAARAAGVRHKVILMADLGDLREGFWDADELTNAAALVEGELSGLALCGIGTNLGCYGSIFPTVEKMEDLVRRAEAVEARIGRKLDIISGGASTSLPRVLLGDMPVRVNQLRVGEAILSAQDIPDLFGYEIEGMHRDVFTLTAEVIEVKDKPSYPQGEIMYDAYGKRPEYEDRGTRRRALLALGRADYAFCDSLKPREPGVAILGASGDHTILDIADAERDIRVGDACAFDLAYPALLYVSNSPNVHIELVP